MSDEAAAATVSFASTILGEHQELLQQGAEARIYRTIYRGETCLAKERFPKKYRIEELDTKLRKRQLAAESRAYERACKVGLAVPRLIFVDKANYVLYLEELKGTVSVRDYISSLGDLRAPAALAAVENIAVLVGTAISEVHTHRIMHGDLTTSNMLVHADLAANAATAAAGDAPALPTKVFLIDFGLSFFSDLVEDRSVDFYVMERAVQTTHAHSEHLIHMVYNTYKNKNVLGNKVMTRLNDVRARGRKKSMIG